MRALGSIAILALLLLPFALNGSPEEVPLLADGVVNLGPLPGENGVWELTYVENMADYVVGGNASSSARNSINRGRTAWGSAAEPQVPFQRWSAARYDYNRRTEAKYDPESFCRPP